MERVVMRPPGHSGKAKRGHLCFDASFETGWSLSPFSQLVSPRFHAMINNPFNRRATLSLVVS